MAIIKCKMCGGDLNIMEGASTAQCEYCGCVQTIPNLDDEKKLIQFERAERLRKQCEFDKAAGIYETIVADFRQEAEAYWGLLLCKYGIEYVDDPASGKKIPTCHRSSFESVLDDSDFEQALENADSIAQRVYREEAKQFERIRKGILEVSSTEKPYDIFICYKETDEKGDRTLDSVLAQDLYSALTDKGYRVFFSRITLQGKLGEAYEPYIFAALNSAKVMLAVGTCYEHYNAVWVKNEWSRYLKICQVDKTKHLIPCYRDLDPEDMPREFNHLQGADLSKMGAIQDILFNMEKYIPLKKQNTTVIQEKVIVGGGESNKLAALLDRGNMALEDGEWAKADSFFEEVLNNDSKNAMAYLGKLLAELKVKTQENLKDCQDPFDNRNNYQKAVRFADTKLKATLEGYIEHIKTRNENARLGGIYTRAKNAMSAANSEGAYKEAAQLFKSVSHYKDAAALAKQCVEKAEIARKDAILADGKERMESSLLLKDRIEKYEAAIRLFRSIPGWKDADQQVELCLKKIEEIKAKEEADRLEKERKAAIARKEAAARAKKKKKIAMIAAAIACAVIALLIVLNTVIIPNGKYNDAVALMDAGKYYEAIVVFAEIDDYKDSEQKIAECQTAILDGRYDTAIALMKEGKYNEAYNIFNKLGDYKDAADKLNDVRLMRKKEELKSAKVGSYIKFGAYEQDNKNGKDDIEWLVLEIKDGRLLVISKYALDCKPYNTSNTNVTWETCTLRKWLNDDFINTAFSAEERAMIPTVKVSADKNPDYSTNPGNATQDKVFLLSITEANQYFSSDNARQCKPTDYALANGAWKIDSGNCWWWLRSPGDTQISAADVYSSGSVHEDGFRVNYGSNAVRPALWIDLNA